MRIGPAARRTEESLISSECGVVERKMTLLDPGDDRWTDGCIPYAEVGMRRGTWPSLVAVISAARARIRQACYRKKLTPDARNHPFPLPRGE